MPCRRAIVRRRFRSTAPALRWARIQLSAAIGWIDEGAEPDLGEKPGLAPRNFAKQMRYASERQIIGLDVIVDRHPGELRNQAEMSANQPFDQAGMRHAVEAAICAVPRRRREHQRKVPRLSGLHEAPL